MRKTILTFIAAFFMTMSGLSAHATVGSAQVVATASYTTNVGDTISLRVQLQGCGTGVNPLYNNLPISLTPNQTPTAPFFATNTGTAQAVTFIVPGNDQIVCSNQTYTVYGLTWIDNGFPLGPTLAYRFIDATNQNLVNLVPISFVPPVLNNAAGALCPAATPVFSGFTATYQIICGVPGTTAGLPLTGGTMSGPINNTSASESFFNFLGGGNFFAASINGEIMADQEPGIDASVQIQTAIAAAYAGGIPIVDATHFSGLQPCTVDMFGAIDAITTSVNIVVNMPAAHFQCSVQQTITNSSLTINGQGPALTQIEYTGGTLATAALWVHAQTSSAVNGLTAVHVSGIYFYGDNANLTDAVLVEDANRSEFSNILAWGANSSGFHCEGCVSDTFYRVRESQVDANEINGTGVSGAHTWPQYGLQLDSSASSGNQTTAGTVVDNAAEFTASAGWWLRSANSMTFTGGTSEDGFRGIVISSGSKWNVFSSPDLEGNTQDLQGVDVDDLGQSNTYIGLLATSACSGCASVYADGGAASTIIQDTGLSTGYAGQINDVGNNQDFRGSEGILYPWTMEVTANASIGGSLTVGTTLGVTGVTTMTGGAVVPKTAVSSAPIITSNDTAATCVAGTGVTSCTLTTGSTAMRGLMTLVNSSATTAQVLATVTWGATLASSPNWCTITQARGVGWYGMYASTINTTTMAISNTNTVSGITPLYISWHCDL